MEKIFVPPIKIQGIITKLIGLIRQNVALEENTTWVEPFMGSGVVGINVLPQKAIFADTNPHTIELYKQIQDGRITSGIVRQFLEKEGKKLQELEAEYYYKVRARFNVEHNPLDFLFLNRSCFNGMIRFNRNYEFNVPYGHKLNKAHFYQVGAKEIHRQPMIEALLTNYETADNCNKLSHDEEQLLALTSL